MKLKPYFLAMQLTISLCLTALIGYAPKAFAQAQPTPAPDSTKDQPAATDKPHEPDVLGVVFYLDSAAQTITPLPREYWSSVATGRTTGFASGSAIGSLQFPGSHSSFRVHAIDKTEFVFNLADPSHVQLFSCRENLEKRVRIIDTVSVTKSGAFHPTFTNTPIAGIDIQIVRYGASSYKLIAKDLAAGEYMILTGSAAYSFFIP
jgi:hypothetical protein